MDFAIFSPSSLFADNGGCSTDEETTEAHESFVERRHQFPGMGHFHLQNDSWGDAFPSTDPDWDLVIASDILLYVKQYANLIKSLSFLLKSYKPKVNESVSPRNSEQNGDTCLGLPRPAFLMSWRRRIGKEDESLFFNGCENAGLEVRHLGSRVYCIKPRETTFEETT